MELNDSIKLYIEERFAEEKKKSDLAYAIKITERIVFGILALFGVAVVAQIIKLVGLS